MFTLIWSIWLHRYVYDYKCMIFKEYIDQSSKLGPNNNRATMFSFPPGYTGCPEVNVFNFQDRYFGSK